MPLHKIAVQSGVNSQQTQTANTTSWWASNLVRFRDGTVEKIGGWTKLFNTKLSGFARALWGYEDLQNVLDLGIGTDAGLQIYSGGILYNTIASQQSQLHASGVNGGTFSIATTNGSAVATVTDTSFSPTNGSTVTFTSACQIGEIFIAANTVVTVTSVNTSAHTWTFNLPANAGSIGSGPWLCAYQTLGATNTQVQVETAVEVTAGGFVPVVNNNWVVAYSVVPASTGQSINVPAGTYKIATVTHTGGPAQVAQFTIETNIQQGSTGVQGQEISAAAQPLYPVNYATQSIPSNVANWFIDNQGQVMLIVYTNGPLLAWTPPVGAPPLVTAIVTQAPSLNAGMLVAMPQEQAILWGTEPVIGTTQTDPLLIRFSDAGSYTSWTATSTNQAGSYRLSRGSKIIGGIQMALTTLIWTDTDIWTMAYVGTPFVYSFNILASGCGLISPKARAILGGTCLWMSNNQFWTVGAGGGGVSPVYCPIWDVIFKDLDPNNLNKINIGANSGYGEFVISWPSISGGTGEIDSYAIYKPSTGDWSYGSNHSSPNCSQYARTTWMDQSVFGNALGGDLNQYIQQHDIGYDADGSAMKGAFVESGYAEISDGNQLMFLSELIPDLKWFGTVPGAIRVTLKGMKYPQGPSTVKGPYGLDMQNRHIRPRMRARGVALRWDWEPRLGFNGRIGATSVRVQPSGRRP